MLEKNLKLKLDELKMLSKKHLKEHHNTQPIKDEIEQVIKDISNDDNLDKIANYCQKQNCEDLLVEFLEVVNTIIYDILLKIDGYGNVEEFYEGFYGKCIDFVSDVGELFLQLDKLERAALIYENLGDVGQLYGGHHQELAVENYHYAAEIYIDIEEYEKAARCYIQVPLVEYLDESYCYDEEYNE